MKLRFKLENTFRLDDIEQELDDDANMIYSIEVKWAETGDRDE